MVCDLIATIDAVALTPGALKITHQLYFISPFQGDCFLWCRGKVTYVYVGERLPASAPRVTDALNEWTSLSSRAY